MTPQFPFNLGFLPEVWRLEHRLHRTSAEVTINRSLVKRYVLLRYKDGRRADLELRLNHPEAFVTAVQGGA